MQNPLVSVVVPVYNTEKFLDECVKSLTEQTYQNLEIILVDDGSPDNCGLICDRWAEADNRIKVIHKINEGVGVARNTGIEKAEGNFIFFVDSDDFLDITTIEKCVKKTLPGASDVVMFGSCDVDSEGRRKTKAIRTKDLYFNKEQIISTVLPGLFIYERGFGISVCMKMFDLSLIRKHNLRFGTEKEFMSEDARFILDIFRYVRSLSIVPEHLYCYRKNENSFSRKYKNNCQQLNDAFLVRCLEISDKADYSGNIKNYISARYHMYSIAGMKQLITSDLTEKEKRRIFKKMFENDLLKSTITLSVLKLENIASAIFWILFKIKCLPICYLVLKYKANC